VRSHDYQIYNPPYLTSGRPRPKRVGCNVPPVAGGMHYRDDDPSALYAAWWDESMPAGVTVEKVVLMRPGSVTHHSDLDARYLELERREVNDEPKRESRISFLPPKNSRYAPRGWYMLFLVTNEKVPSVALWVHLQ
jgi:Galactose oxidase-like, Early set domain